MMPMTEDPVLGFITIAFTDFIAVGIIVIITITATATITTIPITTILLPLLFLLL